MKMVNNTNNDRFMAHLHQNMNVTQDHMFNALKLIQHKIEIFQDIGLNEAIKENIRCNDYILINRKW